MISAIKNTVIWTLIYAVVYFIAYAVVIVVPDKVEEHKKRKYVRMNWDRDFDDSEEF